MATPTKAAAVAEIAENLRASNAAVLTEYRGLSVTKLQQLRRSLSEDAKYSVVKNTLTAIAAKEVGIDAFDGQLAGPTAMAFISGDAIKAAKELTDFAKSNPELVIKSGYYEGEALDAAGIDALAALVSREHQLSRVAGVLQAPMAQMARTVEALRLKNADGAPAEAPAADEAADQAAAEAPTAESDEN